MQLGFTARKVHLLQPQLTEPLAAFALAAAIASRGRPLLNRVRQVLSATSKVLHLQTRARLAHLDTIAREATLPSPLVLVKLATIAREVHLLRHSILSRQDPTAMKELRLNPPALLDHTSRILEVRLACLVWPGIFARIRACQNLRFVPPAHTAPNPRPSPRPVLWARMVPYRGLRTQLSAPHALPDTHAIRWAFLCLQFYASPAFTVLAQPLQTDLQASARAGVSALLATTVSLVRLLPQSTLVLVERTTRLCRARLSRTAFHALVVHTVHILDFLHPPLNARRATTARQEWT